MDRRSFIGGSATLAAMAVLPPPAIASIPVRAAAYPLVPVLPEVRPDIRGRLITKIRAFDAMVRANPQFQGSRQMEAVQAVLARMRMVLIWHRPDSVELMASLARRYPSSALRMQAVIDARLAGEDDWIERWGTQPLVFSDE